MSKIETRDIENAFNDLILELNTIKELNDIATSHKDNSLMLMENLKDYFNRVKEHDLKLLDIFSKSTIHLEELNVGYRDLLADVKVINNQQSIKNHEYIELFRIELQEKIDALNFSIQLNREIPKQVKDVFLAENDKLLNTIQNQVQEIKAYVNLKSIEHNEKLNSVELSLSTKIENSQTINSSKIDTLKSDLVKEQDILRLELIAKTDTINKEIDKRLTTNYEANSLVLKKMQNTIDLNNTNLQKENKFLRIGVIVVVIIQFFILIKQFV